MIGGKTVKEPGLMETHATPKETGTKEITVPMLMLNAFGDKVEMTATITHGMTATTHGMTATTTHGMTATTTHGMTAITTHGTMAWNSTCVRMIYPQLTQQEMTVINITMLQIGVEATILKNSTPMSNAASARELK